MSVSMWIKMGVRENALHIATIVNQAVYVLAKKGRTIILKTMMEESLS